jgi:hypothetical protein
MAFWMKCSAAPAAISNLAEVLTSAVVPSQTLRLQTSGVLSMYNAQGTSQGGVGNINVCDNNWHWIEWQPYNGSGAATCKFYVDSTLEISSSGSMSSSTIDRFDFVSILNRTLTIVWPMFWDSTSAVQPTNASMPLGPRQISVIRPTSDDVVQFGRSSGADNYALLSETVNDGDATYVESGVSGDQDLYNYEDLGFTPTSITCCNAVVAVENPNPGTINFKQICKSGGTQTDGASVIAPPNYRLLGQPFGVDPATAAAWTGAGIDAAKFGEKVV